MRDSRGFTITEVLITIIMLTLGLLALGSSGLFVNGLLDRSGRAAAATNFAARRLELLRPGACRAALQSGGTERLMRGSALLATNRWWFEPQGRAVDIRLVATYASRGHRMHSDTFTTTVLCR